MKRVQQAFTKQISLVMRHVKLVLQAFMLQAWGARSLVCLAVHLVPLGSVTRARRAARVSMLRGGPPPRAPRALQVPFRLSRRTARRVC